MNRFFEEEHLIMKHIVTIPASKTKRFNSEPRLLTITLNQGWGGSVKQEHTIQPDQLSFEFDLPDEYEYICRTSVLDGFLFSVKVTYYNADKTRSETIQLVPS